MESLGYDHDRTHPKYSEFMMDAGMCMSTCPAVETDLFRAQFQAKTEWYQKAKAEAGNGGGNGGDNGSGGDNGGNPPSTKYPFKPDGPCVEACTMVSAVSLFPLRTPRHFTRNVDGFLTFFVLCFHRRHF